MLVWGGMTVIVAIKGAIGGNANTPKNVSYLSIWAYSWPEPITALDEQELAQ